MAQKDSFFNRFRFFKGSNIPAFILSCFFVIYGFVNISQKPWIQFVMGCLGLYVEYEAYKIWGLSFAYKDANKPYKWMRGVYIVYILIFALPSAIGFFAVDVLERDNTAQIIQDDRENRQARIGQLPGLIAAAREDMNYERDQNGGTGRKFEAAKADYDKLSAEYAELMNQKKRVLEIADKQPKPDMFTAVSKVLWGLDKFIIILVMCTAALAMVYIGMMLQPPQYNLIDKSEKTIVKSEPIPPVTPVAGNVTGQEIISEIPPEPSEMDGLTDDRRKFISYVDELYRGIDDSKIRADDGGPVELNSLLKTRQNLRGIVSVGRCRKYKEILNSWGAIVTNNGVNSLGMWPKADIINKIREG
jgi:hypothetical protein